MAKKRKNVNKSIELVEKLNETPSQTHARKQVLTLFLFLLPLLIIAYTQDIFVKIALFFYEAVLLQNYIVDQYRKKDL